MKKDEAEQEPIPLEKLDKKRKRNDVIKVLLEKDKDLQRRDGHA